VYGIRRVIFVAVITAVIIGIFVMNPLHENANNPVQGSSDVQSDSVSIPSAAKFLQGPTGLNESKLQTVSKPLAVVNKLDVTKVPGDVEDNMPVTDSAPVFPVQDTLAEQKAIVQVYENHLRVALADLGDRHIGAIELVLNWDSQLMYPVNRKAVCSDHSNSMIFQQGKLLPGQVRFGLMMPVVSAGSELVNCRFNVVTDDPMKTLSVSVDGSAVYALDASEIASGSGAFKVWLQ